MTGYEDLGESVVIERDLHAPIALVWQMWTDAEHFKAWYGPNGVTVPVAEFDLRVGGKRFVGMEMTTPDGAMRMYFTGEHLSVVEPDRLSYTEAMSDEAGNARSPDDHGTTTVSIVLEQVGDTTRMVLTHVGIPAGSPGASGWNMAFDKLAVYVHQLA